MTTPIKLLQRAYNSQSKTINNHTHNFYAESRFRRQVDASNTLSAGAGTNDSGRSQLIRASNPFLVFFIIAIIQHHRLHYQTNKCDNEVLLHLVTHRSIGLMGYIGPNRVSEKNCANLFFATCLSNINRFQ